MCDYTGQYRAFIHHIHKFHKVSLGEYKKIYGNVAYSEKVLHTCRICSKVIYYSRQGSGIYIFFQIFFSFGVDDGL